MEEVMKSIYLTHVSWVTTFCVRKKHILLVVYHGENFAMIVGVFVNGQIG
jgi:hypothetical protein